MTLIEIAWGVLTLFASILGFYIKRLYSTVDKNSKDIVEVKKDLADHRVYDAATYPSRTELDAKLYELKKDIRGMISPVHTHLHNIENYLRNHHKD